MDRETVSENEEFKYDDKFIETIVQRAKGDLLYVATRLAEVTIRYFQFRARELVRVGFYFKHSYEVEYKDNEIIVVFRISIPEDLLNKYKEEYGKRAKYIRKITRSARVWDRYMYETRNFEDLEGETILREKEEDNNR